MPDTDPMTALGALLSYIVYLYFILQVVLLFLFVRMSHDIHKLKKKWVDQVRFTANELIQSKL